jgi:hypothetical protein
MAFACATPPVLGGEFVVKFAGARWLLAVGKVFAGPAAANELGSRIGEFAGR